MASDLIHNLSPYLQNSRLMPVIILTIAAILLTMSMRRRRPRPAPAPPKPRAESNGSAHLLRRDLDDVMVELQDLSRRISAEIDTRFAKLEAAMKDADRRIAVLNRLSRDGASGDGRPASPAVAVAKVPPSKSGREGEDVRHAVIYELSDAGFTPVEIARDLGRTPGEVELILNLRRQAQRRA